MKRSIIMLFQLYRKINLIYISIGVIILIQLISLSLQSSSKKNSNLGLYYLQLLFLCRTAVIYKNSDGGPKSIWPPQSTGGRQQTVINLTRFYYFFCQDGILTLFPKPSCIGLDIGFTLKTYSNKSKSEHLTNFQTLFKNFSKFFKKSFFTFK